MLYKPCNACLHLAAQNRFWGKQVSVFVCSSGAFVHMYRCNELFARSFYGMFVVYIFKRKMTHILAYQRYVSLCPCMHIINQEQLDALRLNKHKWPNYMYIYITFSALNIDIIQPLIVKDIAYQLWYSIDFNMFSF